MSTSIGEIIGTSETDKSSIYITRFYGGVNRGSMIQLTIQAMDGASYVHLTKEQIRKLSLMLANSFDYDIYPSE